MLRVGAALAMHRRDGRNAPHTEFARVREIVLMLVLVRQDDSRAVVA